MLAKLYKEELPVLTAVKHQPCVSIIMPFDPKMGGKTEIAHSIKIAIDKIARELHKNFDDDVSEEVLNKLEDVIKHLDYTTHKKSVAIYVSPVIEKIYYLNIPVKEKVTVSTSFEIRDIVHNKKDVHEFLVLTISAKNEKLYIGNTEKLKLLVQNHIEHVPRDLPEPVANFTDSKAIKEVNLVKFLHYIDNRLSSLLKSYPLPLFILTTEKTMGYFKKITKHQENITGFIHGNFDDATEADLKKALVPKLDSWNIAKEKYIIDRLKFAEDNGTLITGIHDVWLRAKCRCNQLLVIEKDFYCPAFITEKGETIFCSGDGEQNAVISKDAVDDIIEQVLQKGGDVEFVDDLKNYNRIALIKYYREDY